MKEKRNIKKTFIIRISIFLVLILVIGGTYAWLTLQLKGTKVNVLKAGTLSLVLNDENSVGINEEKAVPMLDEVGEQLDPYHFTLENEGDLPSDYTIYLDDIDLEENETRMNDSFVKYQLIKEGTKTKDLLSTIGTHPNRILDSGTINGNTTITYDLRLWIDGNTGNDAMGQAVRTKIRVLATQSNKASENPTPPTGENPNILNIYSYNASSCLTGEEDTCVELTERPETYEAGTIIKYKVNDTESKYFHVMFDEGNTLTMQQRENLIDVAQWYDVNDRNTYGPTIALPLLENETASWTNVKDQTYTLGTTVFKTNAFTTCAFTECTENKYTFPERTGKARMITAQELVSLGCTDVNNSCPIWIHNYLKRATEYGGTQIGTALGYWTLSTYTNNTHSLVITFSGRINRTYPTNTSYGGIRPVIVIDK